MYKIGKMAITITDINNMQNKSTSPFTSHVCIRTKSISKIAKKKKNHEQIV